MEFVDGETLEALVKKRGRVEPTVALSIFQQILCAVEFAHNSDVIHRDLKPSKIMLTNAGVVKVMDFGIAHVLGSARRTRTGHMVGTIQYMSPEQIKGEKVDRRSDIYSLGILLYELITGQVPFDSDSDYAIIKAQIEEPPAPLSTFFQDIPPRIESVLLRALAKAPTDRFQSVGEMAEVLKIPVEKNHLNGSMQHIDGWLHSRRNLLSSAVVHFEN